MNSLIEVPRRLPSAAPIPKRPNKTTTSAMAVGSPRSWSQKSAGAQSRLMKPARRKGTKIELAERMPATITTSEATAINAWPVACPADCPEACPERVEIKEAEESRTFDTAQ